MTADRIVLTGIEISARHGVYPEEKLHPQLFRVDLDCELTASAQGDDLNTTVDYSQLAQAVAGVVAGDPVDLIETLAEKVAATCLDHPLVGAVTVTVHKPQAPMPVPVADIAVRVHRSRTASTQSTSNPVGVVFSIGSNLGDRLHYLQGAVAGLRATEGISIRSISSVYETTPVGLAEQPDYLNIAVIADSTLPPGRLLELVLEIESEFDRKRELRWGPRTLDIDLVDVAGQVRDDPALTLPHPRAKERAFVLVPWLELDPDAVLAGERVASLLTTLDGTGVRRRDDLKVAG